MLNKVKQRWQLSYKVAQCTTFFIKMVHFQFNVFLRYGVNNYKNSAKLQSFFLKDRRKLSIYRRFRNISFHTNGRRLNYIFFLVTKM